jgi:hypothetical protein
MLASVEDLLGPSCPGVSADTCDMNAPQESSPLASIAKDLHIEKIPVALFGFAQPAWVFSIKLNRIFDGVGRPLFGWLSDRIGREYTMARCGCVISQGAARIFPRRSSPTPAVLRLREPRRVPFQLDYHRRMNDPDRSVA